EPAASLRPRREGQIRYRAKLQLKVVLRGPGGGIPEADRAVIAPGDQGPAVRREGDGVDEARVSSPDLQLPARGEVPQPHGSVISGGSEGPAVRREGDGFDGAPVSNEGTDGSTRRPRSVVHRPEPDDPIEGARRQGRAVRGK